MTFNVHHFDPLDRELPGTAQESSKWLSDFTTLAHGAANPCDRAAISWLREATTLEYEQLA
eukprot:3906591-Alexandrium_andersonii.AAC.1